jgi:Ni/Co efflux regulator RcnB
MLKRMLTAAVLAATLMSTTATFAQDQSGQTMQPEKKDGDKMMKAHPKSKRKSRKHKAHKKSSMKSNNMKNSM